MNTEKVWNYAGTGTKVHAFIGGKAMCRSNIQDNDITRASHKSHDDARTEVLRSPGTAFCATCEKKFAAMVARAEASMMPSTGEGDHLPPAAQAPAETEAAPVRVTPAIHRYLVNAAQMRSNELGRVYIFNTSPVLDRMLRTGLAAFQKPNDLYPVITVAGWAYLASQGIERSASDPGRMSLDEALEDAYPATRKPQPKEEPTMKTTRSYLSPARLTVRMDVTDGPVHSQAFSTTGRMFQVERVSIEYKQDTATGVWSVQSDSDIMVSGTVLKRDGTPSRNDHSRSPGGYFNPRGGFTPTPEWAWLNGVIERYMPVGSVTVAE